MKKHSCLSEETLIDYLERRLSESETATIEAHVSACSRCREMLILQSAFNTDEILMDDEHPALESVTDDVTQRAIQSVFALKKKPVLLRTAAFAVRTISELKEGVSNLLTIDAAPVMVRGEGQCGGENCIDITRTIAAKEVRLRIEKKTGNTADLNVMMSPIDPEAPPIRVTLSIDDQERSSYLLKDGNAQFGNIPFGHCALLFYQGGETLGEYRFEITGSGQETA